MERRHGAATFQSPTGIGVLPGAGNGDVERLRRGAAASLSPTRGVGGTVVPTLRFPAAESYGKKEEDRAAGNRPSRRAIRKSPLRTSIVVRQLRELNHDRPMIGELPAEAPLLPRRRRNNPNLGDAGELVLPLRPRYVTPVEG